MHVSQKKKCCASEAAAGSRDESFGKVFSCYEDKEQKANAVEKQRSVTTACVGRMLEECLTNCVQQGYIYRATLRVNSQRQWEPRLMRFVQTVGPKIEATLFMRMNGLYLLLTACLTCPNLDGKQLLPWKIVFAFANQRQCPWARLVSHRAACLLCFIENFPPASLAAGERGRRGGATRIQRLICLLVKRSSGLHFLMRALIKSGGFWPGKDTIFGQANERPQWSKRVSKPKLLSFK